ncbi:ThuA domain-containing protein [Catalinimonas niigatensis]|uniref:ThuA domain-containing protein n=1 Tax=Catalinimonas niigatensis TaxID=1397264 RepID=UPI0026665460|nr:ThuA domain-containing protein [Catalinimonas niigatensis]WPP51725.1 ThuA domain-containing protein [Catalinimonas niigatensis]
MRKSIFSLGKSCCFIILNLLLSSSFACAQSGQKWVSYEPAQGPGNGKHIVLISGDEEYRSEEALPMLAKILSNHHGFKTTVLFAIDPKTGEINPDYQGNIPGLESLQSADLMVIFTRFRELPDEQMKYIDAYIKSGKPIVGMRTATHAFSYDENKNSPYAKYSFDSKSKGWEDGFGRQVLGETWIDHHGHHAHEGTRALIDGIMQRKGHPILNGVKDIWVPTDVYGTRELTGDPEVLVWGQPTHGMTAESAVNWEKSVMPIAWTKEYTSESGKTARVFTTTMGASVDLKSEDLRRLMVNACYWALEMEDQIPEKSKVDIVGKYTPTMFGFGEHKKGMRPADFVVQQ